MTQCREIKFRAWNTNTSRMVDLQKLTPLATDLSGLFIPFSDDVILMQYTGLKDKNGREIYEGDILKWEYPAGYSLAEIKFGFYDNGEDYEDKVKGNGWYLEEHTHYGEQQYGNETRISELVIDEYPLAQYDFKVIGNIHENPELLK